MTGFLEESEGVRSMTRLAILILCVLVVAVVGTICWYVLHTDAPTADVILALAAVLAALVLNGIVAIVKRGDGD